MNSPTQPTGNASRTPPINRARFSLTVTLLGLLLFIIGAKPEWLGLDRTPVLGFAQICVFMIGLAVICLGGYMGLSGMWGGEEKSIAADIGLRLVATGYVISIFSGLADIFGMSLRDDPRVPFFGPWQQTGVEIGMLVIALGMLLLVPFHRLQKH